MRPQSGRIFLYTKIQIKEVIILSKIKLKETKKDIKVLDKAQNVSAHMKNAFIRSKDNAQKAGSKEQHNSPSDYATDNITEKGKQTVENSVRNLKNPHKKASENANRAKENFQKSRQHMNEVKKAIKSC